MLVKSIEGTQYQFSEILDMRIVHCYKCRIPFAMPKELDDYFSAQGRDASFYCPNGHSQSYIKSKVQIVEEQKNKEIAALQQQIIAKNKAVDEVTDKWISAESDKTKLTRKLKRVEKGVCPCCTRSFTNLKRHMDTMHPEETKK